MKNYTTTNEIIKDLMLNYIKNLSNGLGKVDTHFLTDITNGIISNNSVVLSDFSRSASPNIQIKKGVERLERHLDKYSSISNIVENNYTQMIKPYINNRKLYFVDGGDITKDECTKFENLGYVLDGSNQHKLAKGYKIFEIDTIDNSNQPISLISDIASSNNSKLNDSNKELSENLEWVKRMKKVSETYGKGTFILDRAYDGANIMEEIIKNGDDFIVRANHLNRKIEVSGKQTNISELAKKCKGKYCLNTKFKGKKYSLKVSEYSFRINNRVNKFLSKRNLTLVIVKGYAKDQKNQNEAYMALITTKNITGKDKTIGIVNDYVLRWKIEENFKFKKQQYGLESIKIRKFNRIQALGRLLSIVLFFNNVLNMTAIGKHVRKITKQARKNISFWLYRIADGLSKSIAFLGYDLMIELYPPRQPRRYDLFTVGHIRFNPCLNCSN